MKTCQNLLPIVENLFIKLIKDVHCFTAPSVRWSTDKKCGWFERAVKFVPICVSFDEKILLLIAMQPT